MAASEVSSVRSWRTAFLTLRDETLNSPPSSVVVHHLNRLIFSHSQTLIAVASDLPSLEVTSDLMFLMELARTAAESAGDEDVTHTFVQLCHLLAPKWYTPTNISNNVVQISSSSCSYVHNVICNALEMHDVSRRVSLDINLTYWALMLNSFGRMVEIFLGKSGRKRVSSGNVVVRAIKQCLETVRCLVSVYHRKCSVSDNTELLNFLLSIVAHSHTELFYPSSSSRNQGYTAEFGKRTPGYNSLWEVLTVTFTLIGDAFSRVGPSLSEDIWQSSIQVLKKVMDVLASKNLLVDDNVMARFYTSLLQCLHLVLINPKGSLSDHVAGLVAALRMFFIYGITDRSQLVRPLSGPQKEVGSSKSESGPYRPPHLRKQDLTNLKHLIAEESTSFSDQEFSTVDCTSSDSDYSDNDAPAKDANSLRCSRARVAAIVCIQDLCRADPKYFTAQWSMLLPSCDVLQPRKYEATLMTCLLFDPYLKARTASASTLVAMLDGPASVFLQVAEYKESNKCGSFTALSSSLGQILMQLHTGVLYLIQQENHSALLASLFKLLMLLISSTPYSRMPEDLLPTVISSLQARIEEGFPHRSDRTSLLASAISCLTAALSSSPSSPKVKDLCVAELCRGPFEAQEKSGILSVIFRYCEPVNSPTVTLEALQALRAVLHNYPDISVVCWAQVSSTVHGFLRLSSVEVSARPWKGNAANIVVSVGEKVITAGIKVLDECLRALSGFKGTEDFSDDKLFDTPFTSDYTRTKKISSAPSYGSESQGVSKDGPEACRSGIEQWSEAIEKHMPLALWHSSAMVRGATVTCFAGITSSVFSCLSKEKQHFILNNSINASLNDEVASVRSAACRAIGVISCFPQISWSAEILGKFIHAAEINTHDPLVLVRITASWALANMCDSLRHYINDVICKGCSIDSNVTSRLIPLLIECALRMTKDGDKIKANAVRALGNLSRYVRFNNQSGVCYGPVNGRSLSQISNGHRVLPDKSELEDSQRVRLTSNTCLSDSLKDSRWLGRMVQAFLSCVATGNVKVQWNVCHALSNLFLNETLKLGDMDWAPSVFSTLLLLLRDSPNYKIRIQAAAALAVPANILEYGESFSDVIQGVELTIENLSSDQITPSNFKYRIALEKQALLQKPIINQ
ncbi:uncharacterized protein LOC127813768 isoform X2 [Diospyros lotus]|uniref:uncharacterized protein LOC127813768 isoform X2 n=1 Tax=Diospyros lotus TaxID=55363 RepID=UPI002252B948|nr:uncharacterized protein LOC127813768 isoform X2 [Diospyros lotus]